jgi:hypothetical protein
LAHKDEELPALFEGTYSAWNTGWKIPCPKVLLLKMMNNLSREIKDMI